MKNVLLFPFRLAKIAAILVCLVVIIILGSITGAWKLLQALELENERDFNGI